MLQSSKHLVFLVIYWKRSFKGSDSYLLSQFFIFPRPLWYNTKLGITLYSSFPTMYWLSLYNWILSLILALIVSNNRYFSIIRFIFNILIYRWSVSRHFIEIPRFYYLFAFLINGFYYLPCYRYFTHVSVEIRNMNRYLKLND